MTFSLLTKARGLAAFSTLVLLGGCTRSGPRHIDVGGYRLWTQTTGRGAPTIVFESGGGNDASVWAGVEPEIRRRLKVRTVLYDRAGLGKSETAPGPYRIEDEAAALERTLDHLDARGPIVVVAHSYGGFVAALVAARDKRVRGMVLVDANLAGFFDEARVARITAAQASELDAIERARPALARVLRAFPETARRMREVTFPPTLPTIDIVAERPPFQSAEEIAAWQESHAVFAAASPDREAIFASGSGHFVMTDRPDLVIDAVSRMAQRIRSIDSER